MANEPPKTPFDSWHQQRCHPNAPAGGGGPGCFATADPLGANGLGWDSLPHPNSPAGRHLTAQEIRLPALPERVQSVVNAYLRALRLAPGAVYRETGYQLGQVIDSLLPGLLQMLAVLGISTMAGAGAGAAIGFFLGGVGAAPGAAVGATLGLETGTAVLTWMGLGFLVVAIGQGMGELTGVLRRGISQAWHAPEHHFPYFEIDRAAEDLARAVGILFRLILQGLLAYVLKNGAIGASRAAISTGQTITRNGTRAAADETLAEVSALLRSSKLPDGFVVWLERNWEDLQRNPKLISNKTGPTVSPQAPSSSATPSELKAMKERQGHEDVAGNSGNKSQPVAERTTHEKAMLGEHNVHHNIAPSSTLSKLSGTERIAYDELLKLENATANAHFLSRHGPLTTLDQQLERAASGKTPDGKNLKPVDSARWLNHEDMLDAVNLAHAKYARTGDSVVTIDFDRTIGEGYLKGGDIYATTNQAAFIFKDGNPYTFYPLLKAE